MAISAILVIRPGPVEQIFVAPSHRCFIWNLTLIGPVVCEEKMLKMLTTYIHTDRRQRHTYPISSPLSLQLRWAKTCLFLFVETSGFCILNLFTTKLVQIKYLQNIQFSISIRTLVDVLLFNNIFETNKIEQINCHVLFKQVHTMLFVSALRKKCVAKSVEWLSLGFYVPLDSISVISGRWKGEHDRLCVMKCCLCSGRISPQAGFEPATRWSEVGTARKPKLRPTTLPLFSNLTRGSYGNRQNVPRIKTEQYSKYIFNTNPLAFFYGT